MRRDLELKEAVLALKKIRTEHEEWKVRALEDISDYLKTPAFQLQQNEVSISTLLNIR